MADKVYRPAHYTQGDIETIQVIEAIVNGLPGDAGYLLGNVLKYALRAGKKGDFNEDVLKGNNYAFRLVTGQWRNEYQGEESGH